MCQPQFSNVLNINMLVMANINYVDYNICYITGNSTYVLLFLQVFKINLNFEISRTE